MAQANLKRKKRLYFAIFLLHAVLLVSCLFIGCAETGGHTLYSTANPTADPPDPPDPNGTDMKKFIYFPMTRSITGYRIFVFDPSHEAWAAYNEAGVLINAGRASGGRDFCPDIGRGCKTITGSFRVLSKGDETCISHRYPVETHGGAPMPYCMYFSASGYAIHGSYEVPDYNASHGCIRVIPEAARWLNENFIKIGTKVIVEPYSGTE